MSKQTMSEIIAAYNSLAAEQGKEEVASFKNLAAARAALKTLESHMSNDTPEVIEVEATDVVEAVESEATETGKGGPKYNSAGKRGPKYNSAGKRGPTQGVGAFCKEQILDGKTNAEILEMVAAQFPSAKTTGNCVAYYRAKLKAGAPVVAEAEAEAAEEAAAEAEEVAA